MANPMADTVGKFGGDLVVDFRQGAPDSYGWINLDPKTRQGACMALSNWWIVKTYKNEDFFAWVKTPAGIKEINKMQTDPSYLSAPNKIENRMKFLETVGLKRSKDAEINYNPFDVQRVAQQMYTGDGFKQVSFHGSAGGHATAARVTDYESWFFDPNYGLARFNQRLQFSYWFVAFWKANDFYNSKLGDTGRVVQLA